MAWTRIGVFTATVALALSVAVAQEAPQISAKDAQELAEWARAHASSQGDGADHPSISVEEAEELARWASSQGAISARDNVQTANDVVRPNVAKVDPSNRPRIPALGAPAVMPATAPPAARGYYNPESTPANGAALVPAPLMQPENAVEAIPPGTTQGYVPAFDRDSDRGFYPGNQVQYEPSSDRGYDREYNPRNQVEYESAVDRTYDRRYYPRNQVKVTPPRRRSVSRNIAPAVAPQNYSELTGPSLGQESVDHHINDRFALKTQDSQELPAPANGQGDPFRDDPVQPADGQAVDNGDAPQDGEIVYEDGEFACDDWGFWGTCFESGLFIGAEGLFLVPVGEPRQSVVLTDLSTGVRGGGSPDPTLGAGIRTWLGIQTSHGWGTRVTYSTFGNQHILHDPVVPVNMNPGIIETSYLDAYTVDIELIQRMCIHDWKIDTSFGGRYARLERNHTVIGHGQVGGVDLYGLALGANEVAGAGFTFSLTASKQMDCWWLPGGYRDDCCKIDLGGCRGRHCKGPQCGCGGWSWYAGFRGSLLWADSFASSLTEANAVVKAPFGSGNANSKNKAFVSKDHSEDVFIAEVIAGLKYERCLHCFPASFFFRAGFEYQHWNTGNLLAQSDSFAFLQGGPLPPFGGRVDVTSDAHNGDLNLIGFTIGTGLSY